MKRQVMSCCAGPVKFVECLGHQSLKIKKQPTKKYRLIANDALSLLTYISAELDPSRQKHGCSRKAAPTPQRIKLPHGAIRPACVGNANQIKPPVLTNAF
jgi:hypothetical protein